jgi:hypothetical protein
MAVSAARGWAENNPQTATGIIITFRSIHDRGDGEQIAMGGHACTRSHGHLIAAVLYNSEQIFLSP